MRGERVVPDSSTVPAMMFGNRIGLCLAGMLELPAVTCDTMWRELDIGVDIRVLR
ncbi:MAG: type II toxin-antitoxin system VapC family toxin [Rhodospirillaceae bacterium]|nr:type II toxin-antitoxin system VapC family toxin [Rhodospirillaceae bacterium]MYK16071.1 type II toxin-antitoxin system VapC family toxin [Rhodospirillaceae bacterium]MYK58010.1 type II toxin-antitoxin system VapC family toxin [Rhodospirillaceae bacterium]